MSKSHQRSNREIRKPKQVKAKPEAAPASLVGSLYRGGPGEGSAEPGAKPQHRWDSARSSGSHRPHG